MMKKKMSQAEILEMLETINKQLCDIYDGISISEIDWHGGAHDITDRVFDVNNKSYLIVGKLNETREIALGFRRRYSDVIRKEIR